jgi:hypothetical protein
VRVLIRKRRTGPLRFRCFLLFSRNYQRARRGVPHKSWARAQAYGHLCLGRLLITNCDFKRSPFGPDRGLRGQAWCRVLVFRFIHKIHSYVRMCDSEHGFGGWAMAQQVCVVLSAAEREALVAIVADRSRPRKHVERARIVLASAERHSAQQVAQRIGVSRPTVWRWEQRFALNTSGSTQG